MHPTCRIQLLGGLELTVCGQPAARFRTRKTAELLAYLAYHLRREHSRELLADLLWPECDSEAGRHSLSMALSALRHQMEPPGIVPDGAVLAADRHTVRLRVEAVTTDVDRFEAALKEASRADEPEARAAALAAAVDSYGGELLPGHYGEWIFPEQQRLQERYFQALGQLVEHLGRCGRAAEALQYALRALREDPLREDVHREVIRLHLAAGQPEAARRQYAELERLLKGDLDVAPSEETQTLVRSIAASGAVPTSPRSVDAAAPRPREALPPRAAEPLEPVGGAVPLHSRFYVVRPTDAEFEAAIARRDSVVLVKGPRQVGKTSLLARGLQRARDDGAQVALTHFQVLNAEHFAAPDPLLLALAETLHEQLEVGAPPAEAWDPRRGASLNLRRYVRREILANLSAPLVWALDEVDRLFAAPFGSDVFGLFRSWHDERALDPAGPWGGLTLAIAYSTEAHLFITDIHQSPFNVGTRVSLEDFTLDHVADLNQRYAAPLRDRGAVERYHALLGGQPFLVRRGLHEMAARGTSLEEFEQQACCEHWIYGDHLRRIEVLLQRDPALSGAVAEVRAGRPCPGRDLFYRLRSAGVLAGETAAEARFRCPLYALCLAAQDG